MTVCVVGAGIIGLSTAVEILTKEPKLKVHLIAENYSPNTTSDVAAGLWMPVVLSDTPIDLILKWGKATIEHMKRLFLEDPVQYGVGKGRLYRLHDEPQPRPYWANIVEDFKDVSKQELNQMGWSSFSYADSFETYFMGCKVYLPLLLKKFIELGGTHEVRRLSSLEEVYGTYDVVVNCSGLGAYHLVNDTSCFPVRGQVIKLDAKNFDFSVQYGQCHVLNNSSISNVTLGGTCHKDNWSLDMDLDIKQNILDRCLELVPQLKDATCWRDVVGLRPGRPTVRLELETGKTITKTGQNSFKLVHNYGHGGAGVTLHHGCALEAAELVLSCFGYKC